MEKKIDDTLAEIKRVLMEKHNKYGDSFPMASRAMAVFFTDRTAAEWGKVGTAWRILEKIARGQEDLIDIAGQAVIDHIARMDAREKNIKSAIEDIEKEQDTAAFKAHMELYLDNCDGVREED